MPPGLPCPSLGGHLHVAAWGAWSVVHRPAPSRGSRQSHFNLTGQWPQQASSNASAILVTPGKRGPANSQACPQHLRSQRFAVRTGQRSWKESPVAGAAGNHEHDLGCFWPQSAKSWVTWIPKDILHLPVGQAMRGSDTLVQPRIHRDKKTSTEGHVLCGEHRGQGKGQ